MASSVSRRSLRERERAIVTRALIGDASMYLSNQSLLVIIVVGIIVGWLAGKVQRVATRAPSARRQWSINVVVSH